MNNYSGCNDLAGQPIHLGDTVMYNGHYHTVKLDHRQRFVFESPLGLGDLELLHDQVKIVTEEK